MAAVLFDLLTALLDSWSLWNAVAGDPAKGSRWRAEYLRITYQTGSYRAYLDLVADAAQGVGLPQSLAADLEARYGELQPWPETQQTLRALAAAGIPLGVVTNCSEQLGHIAAARLDADLTTIVTAERAGFYKPNPQPYLLCLEELHADPKRCLFVAGSAYDLVGAAKVGLPTYWRNRMGMRLPEDVPPPLAQESSLAPLLARVEFLL